MRYNVSGEDNLGVLVKALRNEVAERVIFLVEREDCGVWYAFRIVSSEKSWCRKKNFILVCTYEYQVSM